MTKNEDTSQAHLMHEWQANPKPQIFLEVSEGLTVTEVPKSRGRQIRIEGQCPYCLGPIDFIHTLKLIPASTSRPAGQGSAAVDAIVECRCPHMHPNAPENVTGCGQHWVIEVLST